MPKNPTAEPRRSLPLQKAILILKKLIEDARVLPGERWDSPKRTGWRDTARVALEQAGVSNSLLQSFDSGESIVFTTDASDEEMRQILNSSLDGMTAVLQSAINALGWEVEEEPPAVTPFSVVKPTVSIFISHSGKDADLAEALVELLKSGLGLSASEIRCSSVDGYRLPIGVNTESKLREEVNAAKVVVGLITPNSLTSAYVMFELGARWGANLFSAPLLAGVTPGELRGPLSLLNVLSANSEAQLHQLLGDVSKQLGLTVQNAASYVGRISTVRRLAESAAISTTKEPVAAATNAPVSPDPGRATLVALQSRDLYTEDLEQCINQLLDQMTYSGWLLLRHLLMHEPAIDSQPFIEGISIGTQNEQMATAVKAGVVARELKNRGSMSWVELVLSPRFRPALQTVLYRRLAEYSSPR